MSDTTFFPDGFVLQEFVHPSIFQARGANAIQHVSLFQMQFAGLIRQKSGVPIIANNWHAGGQYVGRGTRPRGYKPKGGGELSQHYHARALDISGVRMSVPQLYQCINDNFDEFFAIGLRVIEDIAVTKTWLHGDSRLLYPEQVLKIKQERRFLIVGPA